VPTVFQTHEQSAANLCVALVESPGEADLWVYRVAAWGLATHEGLWYITRDKTEARIHVYIGTFGASNLKIHFVSMQGLAGWQRPHRLAGRLR
jgi:Family of unknown function (DUF6150)